MASATGSYTGNAATNRTISLAFTPKLVIVIDRAASLPMRISNLNTGAYGHNMPHNASMGHNNTNNYRPALTTNGFIVSGSISGMVNVNTVVYDYLASG